MIRLAKDGCNREVTFHGKKVYFDCWAGNNTQKSVLGVKLHKSVFLQANVLTKAKLKDVKQLMIDWELYEKGWYIPMHTNRQLFNYLCQVDYHRFSPKALQYLNI